VRSLRAAAPSQETRVNIPFPSLDVTRLSGDRVELSLSKERPTIIYIFRPNCSWCAANLDNIRSFSLQRGKTIDVIALSTTRQGVDDYVKMYPLPFPTYILDDPNSLLQVGFVATPQTIEVSSSGTIQHSWVGAYGMDTVNAIENHFHVKLHPVGIQGKKS